MIAVARARNVRIAPRKARQVASLIKGNNVYKAIAFLENSRRAVNPYLIKLLKSVASNAKQKDAGTDVDELFIKNIRIDAGRTIKRMNPRAMGRYNLIRKRCSHICVEVGV